jgi:hypothetical protein
MTKEEYAAYEARVAKFFSHGLRNLSVKADENDVIESYFSWHSCECCGDTLGGNRYDCDGYNSVTKEIEEYSVCEDCVYYAEYGRLDDTTMWNLEHPDDPIEARR